MVFCANIKLLSFNLTSSHTWENLRFFCKLIHEFTGPGPEPSQKFWLPHCHIFFPSGDARLLAGPVPSAGGRGTISLRVGAEQCCGNGARGQHHRWLHARGRTASYRGRAPTGTQLLRHKFYNKSHVNMYKQGCGSGFRDFVDPYWESGSGGKKTKKFQWKSTLFS
jgi:hypothetical protein